MIRITLLNEYFQRNVLPFISPFAASVNLPAQPGLSPTDIAGKPIGWGPPPTVLSLNFGEMRGWISRNFHSRLDPMRNLLLPGGVTLGGLLAADVSALPVATVGLYGGGAFFVGLGVGVFIGHEIDNIP